MKFTESPLKGSYVIDLEPFSDERGWFARTYCKKEFAKIGHTAEWVQLNHSCTRERGALRGMHFQFPPYAEIKLVRCVAGSVYDVIVDLRKGSPTFLKWFGAELSAGNRKMIYIPQGFAHGFQTLANDTELVYHHSAPYTPESEGAIRYDDPKVGIQWKETITDISGRDIKHPYLDESFPGINL